jgi:uncharacterized protein DUF6084
MPELRFAIEAGEPLRFAAVPTLRLTLGIDAPGESIRSISLDTQIRIAIARRSYDGDTRARLIEVVGQPPVNGLFWTRTTTVVPAFTDHAIADLLVPCSYDFDVAATSYLDALTDGDIPLVLLFSGTVFYAGDGGFLQAERIAWDRETEFRLPVATWRAIMEHYFPNTSWVRLRRDTLGRLQAYKARRALPTWDDALEALLRAREA